MVLIRNQRVSNAFTEYKTPALVAFCRNVVTQTATNLNYTSPDPTLAVVTAAIDKLDLAQQAAFDGGRQAIIHRDAAKAELLVVMRQLAGYVQSQCQNDLEILVSSGFLSTKTPAPIGPVSTPQVPVLRQGPTTGKLTARTNKVRGASAYNWRLALATAPGVYVQIGQTTAARITFEGLTAGQTYIVQANALGTMGESDWTAETSRMVM